MPAPHILPGSLVIGFGVCLFVALVCLLKWQYRKHVYGKVRMRRGLRAYADHQKDDSEYTDSADTEQIKANG